MIYFNHSVDKNVDPGEPGSGGECNTYAIKDIQAGEDIVDNYCSYDHPEWLMTLFDK